MTRAIRPMPSDFPAIGPTLTKRDAQILWRAGDDCVNRWHLENGSRPFVPCHRVPPPEDFATLAPTMSKRELCQHYHCCKQTVDRWLEAANVQSRVMTVAEMVKKAWDKRGRVEKKPTYWKRGGSLPNPIPGRDGSLHGMAADHLRPAAAVYRCSERGRADQKGEFWRYGNVVLTPDELLARACAKGFNPCDQLMSGFGLRIDSIESIQLG